MKQYRATMKVLVVVDVPVTANSMEQALEKAQNLENTDIVDMKGDYVDGRPAEVVSVFTEDDWLE